MHLSVFGGTTSKIVQIPVYDSSSSVGGNLTGLVFNTASLVCWYSREGVTGAAVQISLVTATKGTWTSSGFVAVDGTNMPGWYELHVPNAAIASGAKSVSIQLRGATNMVPVNIIIELTAVDNQDAVRGGITALPSVATGGAGAIPTTGTGSNQISVSSGQVILQNGTGTGQLSFTSGVVSANTTQIAGSAVSTTTAQLGVNAVNIGGTVAASATIGTVTTATTATNLSNAPTAGDLTLTMKTSIADAVWNAARSSFTATGTIGQLGQQIIRDSTATAGTSTSITLDAGASTTANFYQGGVIMIYGGTGAGQAQRTITAYSTGRVATISPAWITNPDATSTFIITAFTDPPYVGSDGRVLVTADSFTSGETVAAVAGAVGSVTGSVGSVAGAVASVTAPVLIQSPIRTNTALNNFTFQMYSSAGTLLTGLTVTSTVKIDAGSYGATTNAATEIANGTYVINLAAADLNGTVISLRFSASGAVDTDLTILMQP